jgi:hypothetical protein
MLTELPKDDSLDVIQDKIHEKEAELQAAQHEIGVNLSERFQKLAQFEVTVIEKELSKLRSQCTINSCNASYDSCTLAELDKKRAIANASKESWQARASKKSSEIGDRVEEILDDITNAEHALQMQKQHIQELHQTYKLNWSARQDVILRSHNAKISQLQNLCQSKASPDNASTSLTALQTQVAQLLAQLATLGVQPVVSCGVAVPVELVTGAETIDFGTGTCNPDFLSPPTMSPEEQASRLELRNANLESNDTGKGKGKGTETSAANPGLLY